jgi:membrane protease YdiL (CAAX protease family)
MVPLGIAVSAAVALIALFAGQIAPLPEDGFVSGSFVTHSVMLVLSIGIIRLVCRRHLADFGFTRGTYRFKPAILLWALPTAVLSLLSMLVSGGGDPADVPVGLPELRLVVFVWIWASICEEVLTRGLLQTLISGEADARSAAARFSMPVVVSGLFFGAMHVVLIKSMGPLAAVPIVLATLLGFLAARYREVTGSLIPAVIIHALFNVGGMLPGWVVRWASW